MNSSKQDSTLRNYLNSIDTGDLLTREEESELIQNIEVYQKEILKKLTQSNYGRSELYAILKSLDSSGQEIVDISKKLDDESDSKQIQEIASKFKMLIDELSKNNVEASSKLLEDVSITGTIIHKVVTEVKKKHALISDVESKFKQIKKYFYNETDDEIKDQISSNSIDLKLRIAKEYSLNDIKVSNKLSEWNLVLNEITSVENQLNGESFKDVKSIYSSISTLEFKASKYRDVLIERNLRLVISRAKSHLNKGLDFEDLIQEGNIGLMKAVDKFDSSRKTKISTYATWWIDQSIRRAISNKSKTVRVPTHIEWQQIQINKVIHKLTSTLQRPPTMKEISDESGVDLKVLEDLQTRAQHEIGIDEELSSGLSLIEVLPSDASESPLHLTEQKILKEKIREILSTLNPRTEKIIRLRFGIGEIPDDEGTTLQDIANQVGITKQGVRVVETSALKQLRKKAKRLVNG